MSKVSAAYTFATRIHKNQVDKSGHPYISHVLAVSEQGSNEEEQILGALHDTVEDAEENGFDKESIRLEIEQLFGKEMLSYVDMLSKPNGSNYLEYISNLIEQNIPTVLAVKRYDIRNNLSRSHLIEDTETKKRLEKKYIQALALLSQ
jgi:guanosine-3',5'-bis(diphosphate) 3'-pyrophosphohydrolase